MSFRDPLVERVLEELDDGDSGRSMPPGGAVIVIAFAAMCFSSGVAVALAGVWLF